jgi:hypothetical protein
LIVLIREIRGESSLAGRDGSHRIGCATPAAPKAGRISRRFREPQISIRGRLKLWENFRA